MERNPAGEGGAEGFAKAGGGCEVAAATDGANVAGVVAEFRVVKRLAQEPLDGDEAAALGLDGEQVGEGGVHARMERRSVRTWLANVVA